MIKLTRSIGLTVVLGVAFMVAGCESQYGFYTPPITVHLEPIHPSFGNAIEQNNEDRACTLTALPFRCG